MKKPTEQEVFAARRVLAANLAYEYPADTFLNRVIAALEDLDLEGEDGYNTQGVLIDLALEAGIDANEFFRIVKDAAWDRPSAFSVWCTHANKPEREIAMQASRGDREEVEYLHTIFGDDLPAELMANDWDT